MPKFGPIKQKDLIRNLKRCDFDGPYSGGKHLFMAKEDLAITIPNPHRGEIGKELLSRILRQTKISKEVWERI
ncbi:MAG: type II toxin-antitoxin system HicA family toxin [bacterium]